MNFDEDIKCCLTLSFNRFAKYTNCKIHNKYLSLLLRKERRHHHHLILNAIMMENNCAEQ